MGEGKYLSIWKKELPFILSAIKESKRSKLLNAEDFQQNGNREKSGYGFRLEIENGIVPRKAGSAVARDLKEVLDDSSEFHNIAKGKNILIQMGKGFELNVKVNDMTI